MRDAAEHVGNALAIGLTLLFFIEFAVVFVVVFQFLVAVIVFIILVFAIELVLFPAGKRCRELAVGVDAVLGVRF